MEIRWCLLVSVEKGLDLELVKERFCQQCSFDTVDEGSDWDIASSEINFEIARLV